MIAVLLVRHADIDTPPSSADPPLNAAGRERAQELDRVADAVTRVAGIRLEAVFVSPLQRTEQTVARVTTRLGIPAQVVPPPATFASQVLSGALGEIVLVAGHSNTVPEMITALGVPPPAPVIGEKEFDNLFVVTIVGPSDVHLVRLRYGKPST